MKTHCDYFTMMENQVAYCVKAAEMLQDHLLHFKPTETSQRLGNMHALEHEADDVKHELLRKLSQEFITPIERDDILQLVQIIDDVTDAIDDVAIKLYMLNVQSVPPEASVLAAVVVRCTRALAAAMAELRNFKKPERLEKLVIEINNIESEADNIYIEAVHTLFCSGQTSLSALSIREIYECLETCCDLCEHAADVLENTIMRNT